MIALRTINGWTGASLLPNPRVLASIFRGDPFFNTMRRATPMPKPAGAAAVSPMAAIAQRILGRPIPNAPLIEPGAPADLSGPTPKAPVATTTPAQPVIDTGVPQATAGTAYFQANSAAAERKPLSGWTSAAPAQRGVTTL